MSLGKRKECVCVNVCVCECVFVGQGFQGKKKKKKKTQGWPPVPSVSLLDWTGILIRSAEYRCFIPRGRLNTHSPVSGRMLTVCRMHEA